MFLCMDDVLSVANKNKHVFPLLILLFLLPGSFIDFTSNNAPQRREPRPLLIAKLAFVFWTIIDFLFIYCLYYSVLFKFWVIYHTLLFIFVTKYFGGFHNIQYRFLEKTNIT